MDWTRIQEQFTSLPGCTDVLFHKLWDDKRLRFDGRGYRADIVDEYSARLVCAALTRGRSLLIVLPDSALHRPALLLATGLIREWIDNRQSPGHRGPVLYFGTTVGIREQLRHTSIQGMRIDLADVFRQHDLGRKDQVFGISSSANQRLPSLVTIYSPPDPSAVIRRYRPRWIAVDCDDAPSCDWLKTVMEIADAQSTAVIAWGQNSLADFLPTLITANRVFLWPCNPRNTLDIRHAFETSAGGVLQPLILRGSTVQQLSLALQRSGRALAQYTHLQLGRLGRDALAIHWKLLRAIESLAVPTDFYEAEASRYWGLQPLTRLREGCSHFRSACDQSGLSGLDSLQEGALAIDEACTVVRQTDPPLWTALSNSCVEEPPQGIARLITFPNRSRRDIFMSALLALYNITEQDLQALRTWVITIDDLRRWSRSGIQIDDSDPFMPNPELIWQPLLVGLPGLFLSPKLLPVLVQATTSILIYPHQRFALSRRADDWIQRLEPNLTRAAMLLGDLSQQPAVPVPQITKRFAISTALNLDVKTTAVSSAPVDETIWTAEDPATEVTRLFDATQDLSETLPAPAPMGMPPGQGTPLATTASLWCDSAFEIRFSEGWRVLLPPDATINAIIHTSAGPRIQQRFVAGLKPKQSVLFIHGQQRQDLYDLILSRVHRHPSLELHLALIRRWQADFKIAFEQWQRGASATVRDMNALLQAMRARGSSLSCDLTMEFWLQGQTLCPRDPDDLRRLAEVLNLSFVKQHYRRIHAAATRLRGLHISLSSKLNNWLEQQADAKEAATSEIIDEQLGLTFDDFRSSLLYLNVSSVAAVAGPFLRADLGILNQSDNA